MISLPAALLATVSPQAAWLVAGLALCGLELVAAGIFLLPVGLAACGTGLLTAAAGLDWHGQVGGFVVLAVVLVALAAMRMRRHRQPDTVNAPSAGLIGTPCRALAFEAGVGRVALRDGTWQARSTDGGDPAPGEPMRVVGLDGTTLLISRPGSAPSSAHPPRPG